MKKPEIIEGNQFIDVRGSISFVNDFNFESAGIKRFYQTKAHTEGQIYAWHGHVKEEKYVYCTKGAVLIKIVSFESMSKRVRYILNHFVSPSSFKIHSFVLSDKKSQILHIPPGYYNGFKILTDDTQVMFFSTSTLEESRNDDFREEWNILGKEIWGPEYR